MTSGLEKIGRRWVDDAYVTRPSDVPEVVYHYTDAAGLLGALSSSTLWATDYRFLNDKSEVIHTRKIGEEEAENYFKDKDDKVSRSFFSEICDLRQFEIPDDVFVFSMSQEEDDLSQWRGYAREGKGFTIGLSGPMLNSRASLDGPFSFFKVEYDEKRQRGAILKALKEIDTELRAEALKDVDNLTSLCQVAAREYDWIVEQRSAANKHKSFSAEREWRLLAYISQNHKADSVKVRTSGIHLVNYAELRPRAAGSELLPVVRIGIGPGFRESYDVHAVNALCRKYDYNPDIYFADSPFRRD